MRRAIARRSCRLLRCGLSAAQRAAHPFQCCSTCVRALTGQTLTYSAAKRVGAELLRRANQVNAIRVNPSAHAVALRARAARAAAFTLHAGLDPYLGWGRRTNGA